ncbi:MAG TPA: glycosyltransferase [Polyangiaceae bacterium]|nr:glycosyltransferase [Polyangiaceae bacterium]
MQRIRVLYVTDRYDGPYRYRVQQACEQLRASGDVANVFDSRAPNLVRELPRYGAVVLFRLPWSERVDEIVQAARRAGLPVFFDVDDLTFDPSFSELMPFRGRYGPEEWARAYGHVMAAQRRTFDSADFFVGSTPELVEQARRLGKTSFLHRNVVPEAYLGMGRWTVRTRRALRTSRTIGYFSGSDTHDADFASIAAPLARVLERNPDVRLLVVGYLDLPGAPVIEQRTVRLPYMHYKDFALAYASCHVVLAPLAVENAFTNSKSALKFFEAGAFETPTVATPIREMREAISDGKTGFLARTEREWEEAITRALVVETSDRVGHAARAAVETHHSAAAHRDELHALFAPLVTRGTASTPAATALEPPDETGRRRTLGRALRPGRAARDVLRVLRAARRAPGPEIDTERLDRFLRAVEAGGAALREARDAGAVVILPATHEADVIREGTLGPADVPGEERGGRDPSLTRGGLDVDPSSIRYVCFRMRAESKTGSTRVQFFWQSGDGSPFSEARSVSRAIPGDGFDRTYLLDLHDDAIRKEWLGTERVACFRIDPMDRPGSFRISAVVLLPTATVTGEAPLPEMPRESDVTELAGPEAPRLLDGMLRALPAGGRVVVRLHGPAPEIRRLVAGRAEETHATLSSLTVGPDAVTATFSRVAPEGRRPVDVVIPIWNAPELVRACIESVKRHAPEDARIVAIDDASPDPKIAPLLADLARGDARVVVLSNEKNLGFVGTANRGMRHAEGRDVLLLNSDTEVYAGFLSNLADAAYSGSRVGMTSPLSNNATICSVPEFCRPNPIPEGLSRSEMAALVNAASERRRPELVTPHGFCLYIRRDCLDAVGLFDEARFGRGFGEENDFGERAKALGYRIVLADDVFVFHAGKGSFEEEGVALESRNQSVLEQRHPGYHAAVATFVRENPLSSVHAALARHLSRRTERLAPAPLVLLHASPFSTNPGGVEYCAVDLVKLLAAPRVVLAYPGVDSLEVAEIIGGDVEKPSFYRFPVGTAPPRFCLDHAETVRAFEELLDLFGVGWVHIHHLMFLPLSLGSVLRRRKIPYVFTVHDFYPVCRSFNLLDLGATALCGPEACHGGEQALRCQRHLHRALDEAPSPDPLAALSEHRRAFTELLDGAERVLFPSRSVRDLTKRGLPLATERLETAPHGVARAHGSRRNERAPGPLRVALVGQVAYPSKGAEDYLRAMELSRGAPIEWHVFGRTDLFDFDARLAALQLPNRVTRHGGYARRDIVEKLRSVDVDVALLLPPWPETFSYTLSESEAAGLFIVARRIGALADRLEGAAHGVLVEDAREAAAVLRTLAADPAKTVARGALVPTAPAPGPWAELHRDLYADCAKKSPMQAPRPGTRKDFRRLNELAVVGGAERGPAPAPLVTRPLSKHTSAWWYGYAERAKPYVPESVRSLVRRSLSGDESKTVLRFRLPGKRAKIVDGLSLDRRYLRTAKLVVHGSDPQLVLEHSPFSPAHVSLVRFNLWCSTDRPAHAQLYFRHAGDEHFSEEKSFRTRLDGATGAWQEYLILVDSHERRALWYEGGPIVALRFDPIDVPGVIGLGELALCGPVAPRTT